MKYDVVVVGSGAGGFYSALSCVKKGYRVALIEREELGGTTFRWGSLAVKRILDSFRSLDESLVEELGGDLEKLYRDRFILGRDSLMEVEEIIGKTLKENKVDLFVGNAKIDLKVNGFSVIVDDNKISAKNVILATGTTGKRLWKEEEVVTHKEFFKLKELPRNVCIVGGNVEGIEIANITSYMGIDTTVVEMEDSILKGNITEAVNPVEERLKKKGSKFKLNTRVEGCISTEEGIKVELSSGEKNIFDLVIVTGIRESNLIEGVDLEVKDGFITVDNNYETSIKGIYAVGDINGIMGMANVAKYQGEQMGDIISGSCSGRSYPNYLSRSIYTIPEIAVAGENTKSYGIGLFKDTFRGWSKGIEDGFIRVDVDEEERIVGITLSGKDVSEYLGIMGTLIENKTSIDEAKKFIFAHPTMMEAFLDAINSVDKKL